MIEPIPPHVEKDTSTDTEFAQLDMTHLIPIVQALNALGLITNILSKPIIQQLTPIHPVVSQLDDCFKCLQTSVRSLASHLPKKEKSPIQLP
jgi:hypothetical protein